ncbi:MMS19 nucleotide excision repair protein -like protein [Escovopsis weberi]|uniref:MMS19 nucleotide excision repair protein n=1 Tax=Escovopsis weberi TaxID=150374 RepID=A0A0M8N255_ESCWE|nr:MMS19 nucleotide excision repair protein -like protein [Escovopsis weberi]
MADFRQLAREFVLEDDAAKLADIAQRTAAEIQNAPAYSNPVARWVEAVQPWMPGSNDDANELPDWTSRAKALEFLSRTLDFLSLDLLTTAQVKLLIAFFGAMFDVDHKAGILASASALSRIITMRSFHPSSGYDIITKTCALQDDFLRQAPKTRLAVYELLRSLITNSDVAHDLQRRDGAEAGFMVRVMDLCRSERDPDCLDIWFDTLTKFLKMYQGITAEVVEKVYQAFYSYFPITVPRRLQTGVTTDDLKLRLRGCFSSSHRLAKLAFPFLIEKLDQGYGVTVAVKLDVLKTIKACLEEYTDPEESVIPHVLRLWTCLKYEVRNGDVEDTIWATLEVLKTLALRLQDENLRDYTLNVTRDCVDDLSNPIYTARAGRLLVSVLSASPTAFVLMVAPIITHIKEHIRRPKSPAHSQDLFKLLQVTLEARVLLAGVAMSNQDRSDFTAIDAIFKNLFNDVYKAALQKALTDDAGEEELQVAAVAAQGAGALMSARTAAVDEDLSSLLLPEAIRAQICQDLFSVLQRSLPGASQKRMPDDLVNEVAKALQRAVRADPRGFQPLADQAIHLVRVDQELRQVADLAEIARTLGPLLGYVGCSELPKSKADGMRNFLSLFCGWTKELLTHIDQKTDSAVWCAFLAGIQSIARYFSDALPKAESTEEPKAPHDASWVQHILERHPSLSLISGSAKHDLPPERLIQNGSVADTRDDFLLICLFVVRHLYRRATAKGDVDPPTGRPALGLSDDFSASPKASDFQYLHLLSSMASFVVHDFSESRQQSLGVERYALDLFQDETITIPATTSEKQSVNFDSLAAEGGSPWRWVLDGKANVLALGLFEGLRASGVKRLFDTGVPFELLISGALASPRTPEDSWTRPVARSILAVLANKYSIESAEGLMAALKLQLTRSVENARSAGSPDEVSRSLGQASSVIAIASGLLRRYGGKSAKVLVEALGEAPNDAVIGHHLARRLEMTVAPQQVLTKEEHAVVKPIWLQRVYVELVKPMVPKALSASAAEDRIVRTNFGIAVLLMVKHLPFSVYEEHAGQILRIAISAAQTLGPGAETLAALQVFKGMLAASPETAQAHLHSLVHVCIACLTDGTAPGSRARARPEWMPEGYLPARNRAAVGAGCQKLALEILAALPIIYEPERLLSFGPKVRKELCIACGHSVRELRGKARDGCTAWADVK